MIPDDLQQMADYLGREDPAIRRLLKAALRDPDMVDAVRAVLKRRCVKLGFDPDDVPVFWPVRELPPGFAVMGRVARSGLAGPGFALSREILTQHVGVFGHAGSGKSWLVMHLVLEAIRAGLRVWIFDIEDEYSRLQRMLPEGSLVALEPQDLRINFFEPPAEWVSLDTWLDEIGLFLRSTMFFRDGMENLFVWGMNRLLERKGVLDGGSDWPSLIETAEFLGGLKFGAKSRSGDYLESLLNRFARLVGAFQYTARVTQSDMLRQLAARPVIFRLHGLTGIPLQFLVGYLLLWLSRYREGVVDGTTHAVTIEESHMLASDKARRDIGEDMLSRQFRTARKRGIALILCDQVPSGLPREILGNLGTRFVMRLVSAPCIWSVQTSMGLDRAQADAIAELEPRRAVVQYPLHPRPFLVEVPELQFPVKPDPAELRRQAMTVLAETRWTESEPPTVRTPRPAASTAVRGEELSGDARLVMVRLCEHPAESIEQRCTALRIDRGCEFRARAELDARGYITKVEQTIGGKIKFFRPTDKGTAWAKAHGVRVKAYKSGVVHEYLLSQVERCIGLMSSRWRLQRNSSIARDEGLQPDLLVLAPEGGRFVVEVCCHNVDYDADNMLDEAGITGIDKLIAVTPDKGTKDALEKRLRRLSTDERAVQGAPIEVFDAHECLAERFDWSAVLAVGEAGD